MRSIALAAVLLALAATAGTAQAATVTGTSSPSQGRYGGGGTSLAVQGGPAADVITATPDGTGAVVLTDTTDVLTLTPYQGCAQLDDHTVRCASFTGLSLSGGPGDDTLTFAGAGFANLAYGASSANLVGGDGDDTLNGSAAAETLDGGAGDDVLDGGDGSDYLDGGPGADTVRGGAGDDVVTEKTGDPGAADRLDGGDGADRLQLHSDPEAAATLDVRAGTISGAATATLTGFESYMGTYLPGRLVLAGGDGPDDLVDAGTLDGRGGDDHLITYPHGERALGGEGNDVLSGANGTFLDGGPGDDVLSGPNYDGQLAGLACGPGEDWVLTPGHTLIPLDCEHAADSRQIGFVGHPRAGRTTVSLPFVAARTAQTVPEAQDAYLNGCGLVAIAYNSVTGHPLTGRAQLPAARFTTARSLRLPLRRAVAARAFPADATIELSEASRCPRRRPWPRLMTTAGSVRVAART